MVLPERLYYSITKVLKEINKNLEERDYLDFEDLFHFAFIGELEICTLIDYSIDGDQAPFLIFFKSNPDYKNELCNLLDNIIESDSNIIKGNCGYFSIDGYSLCDDLTVVIESENISLLVAVHQNFFSPVLDYTGLIKLNIFNIPRTFELPEDNPLYKYSKFLDILYSEKEIAKPYKNLYITRQELNIFKNGGREIPHIFKKNRDPIRPGQKAHPLKNEIILIASQTKEYYLNNNIDLGLVAIATKIKNHKDYSDKGLPSPEQMATWFRAAGIETSKTTKTFDFDLILKKLTTGVN